MTSTFTSNKNLDQPALGDDINTWYIPVNNNFSILDSALAGQTVISGLTGSNRTLTQAELVPSQIVLQGTLTANIKIIIPASAWTSYAPNKISGSWVFYNATTNTGGPWTITLQCSTQAAPTVATGSVVNLPQGYSSAVYSDGTSVYYSDNRPLGVPTGGSGDEIFFVNGQTVTADYTIPTNYNAVTAGPVTINSGVTVTIPGGSTWAVV